MSVIPMKKVYPFDDGFDYIVDKRLKNALPRGTGEAKKLWRENRLDLWVAPGKGFLLIQKKLNREHGDTLFIYAIEGRDLQRSSGFETLRKLAIMDGCKWIECRAFDERQARALSWFGFELINFDGVEYTLRKEV